MSEYGKYVVGCQLTPKGQDLVDQLRKKGCDRRSCSRCETIFDSADCPAMGHSLTVIEIGFILVIAESES